jgi:hypothetical protein
MPSESLLEEKNSIISGMDGRKKPKKFTATVIKL